jgi:YHS domain-containing protein
MGTKHIVIALFALTMAVTAVFAKDKVLLSADANGVVLQGYDPVTYFTQGSAVRGEERYKASYKGGTYHFVSDANKKLFKKDPAKYAPQYGGYCAMAVSMGQLEEADPKMFTIHKDKLLVQRNEKAHQMFMANPDALHDKADQQWPGLVEKNGK